MKKVKLGEVATFINGYAFKPQDWSTEGKEIIRIQNLTKTSKEINYYSGKIDKKYIVETGDILISWSGTLGVFQWYGKTAVLNQHIFKAVFDKLDINKSYFKYVVEKGLQDAVKNTHGSTMKHLTKKYFDNIIVSYTSLKEQQKISRKLDLLSKLISMRQEQLEELNLLVKSRFNELFGDLFLNEFKWDYASFNEFAKFDTKMISDFTNFIDLPHIGIDSIEKNTGKLIGYRTVGEDQISSGKYLFTKKHIIYSKIRPNLNKVALPDFMGVCSADAYPILTVEEKMNRIFLAHVLRSDYFLNFILSFSSRTNLPKVNKSQISKFKCPLPPLSLQNEFADFVAQVDKSQFACQMAIKLWRNSLKSSII